MGVRLTLPLPLSLTLTLTLTLTLEVRDELSLLLKSKAVRVGLTKYREELEDIFVIFCAVLEHVFVIGGLFPLGFLGFLFEADSKFLPEFLVLCFQFVKGLGPGHSGLGPFGSKYIDILTVS